MNDHQAKLIAQRVSEYLDVWNDRQSPFLKELIDDPAWGRQRQRNACQAFHSGVIRLPEVPEDLKDVPRDEYETHAFLRLLCPDDLLLGPGVDLNGLLSVLRCAFPDGLSRYQMIPQFVLAYGCGNWRDGAPWPDAVATLARMTKAASFDAQRYVLDHVYGAGQYADNPAVLRAAKRLSRPPAHIVQPLHIQNTAQFAEALVGTNRQPILVETGAVLRMAWLFDHVEIPDLATKLKAGAKRVFACTTAVTITTSNGPLDAQAGEFFIVAARERGFDVIVTDASGVAKGSRKLRGGTADVQGHAELELSNCHCGSEACSSRHALRAWSPRSFDRLTFPLEGPRSADFFWDGALLQVRGVAEAGVSIQVEIGDHVVLAFPGVANKRPVLHLLTRSEVARHHGGS